MSDPIRKFEIGILRPLWLVLIVAVGLSAVQGRWVLAVASIVACGVVGTIGSGLHPKLSARDLVAGPTAGSGAQAEPIALTSRVRFLIW